MTSVAKPSIVQLTKALAIAGAFVTFGCAEPRVDASSQLGRQWVHQGEAQGTTYTIKYVSRDSVPHAAFESCLEQVDVEMNAWRPESTLSQFNAFTEIHKESSMNLYRPADQGMALTRVFDTFCADAIEFERSTFTPAIEHNEEQRVLDYQDSMYRQTSLTTDLDSLLSS